MEKGGDVGHSMEYDKQAASLKRKEDQSNGETPAKIGRETSSPSLGNRARANSLENNSDDQWANCKILSASIVQKIFARSARIFLIFYNKNINKCNRYEEKFGTSYLM